jgi:hypothetical protein
MKHVIPPVLPHIDLCLAVGGEYSGEVDLGGSIDMCWPPSRMGWSARSPWQRKPVIRPVVAAGFAAPALMPGFADDGVRVLPNWPRKARSAR